MKRIRPAPMGRAYRYQRRIAHHREVGGGGAGSRKGCRGSEADMGQKVHPYGFRLGVTKTWRSRWFAKQDYAKLLHEDLELKAMPAEPAEGGGRQLDRSRPSGQQAAHHDPHLASRASSSAARARKSRS